jgi:hypothetical protein
MTVSREKKSCKRTKDKIFSPEGYETRGGCRLKMNSIERGDVCLALICDITTRHLQGLVIGM